MDKSQKFTSFLDSLKNTENGSIIESIKLGYSLIESTVSDASGSPIPLYHGSPYKFDAFDVNKIAESNGRSEGPGFYFTTDKATASGYADGGYLYEVYLDINKPITEKTRVPTRTQTKAIIFKLAKLEMSRGETLEIEDTTILSTVDIRYEGMTRGLNQIIDMLLDVDNILDFVGNLIGMGIPINDVNQAIYSVLGYDSYISNGFSGMGVGGGTIYIAMFPNQIDIRKITNL